ncbi:hypothetical protein [Nocardia salmonicida]|uniref:hypothetical protein n=1 Tax=Nocardia salmonicida TaxID=53431 RepID=UPI0007A5196A|nr:hypothetical protein [Nocardia salmonicida]
MPTRAGRSSPWQEPGLPRRRGHDEGALGQITSGATVNATVAERDSDGGGAVFHDNRVEVRPR